MINAWRDLEVTDRVALYLGGGIGGGGYTVAFNGGFPALGVGLSGSTAVTGFAWQAGGVPNGHLERSGGDAPLDALDRVGGAPR